MMHSRGRRFVGIRKVYGMLCVVFGVGLATLATEASGESAAGRIRSAIRHPTLDLSVLMVFMAADTVEIGCGCGVEGGFA
jgi:hypothetical protein